MEGVEGSAIAIDTCGFKKDGFYFYQSQWTKAPMVHPVSASELERPEAASVLSRRRYTTNCADTAEQHHSTGRWGARRTSSRATDGQGRYGNVARRGIRRCGRPPTCTCHGTCPMSWGHWQRWLGQRTAVAVVTTEVSTTGEPAAIRLTADRTDLSADRRDVAHLMVEVLDAQGRVVPMAENEVTFEVQGEGKLIGVDNGNPQSHDSYKTNRCKAFNGLCLSVVRATAKAGAFRLPRRHRVCRELE